MRVADYVIEQLLNHHIKHIFTVTGRGILYLTDALAKQEGVTGICVHHEQAGAYAAMAYAQATNQMGACLVSTGCGATNTITGVLNAWQDAVPCIFISGQNMLEETVRHTKAPIRTYGSQEADIVALVAPITKYAVMIEDPNQIAYEMDKAFYMAAEGIRGPVWIDIPLDIQNARIELETIARFTPESRRMEIDPADVAYVAEAINRAKRSVLLIGSGIRASGAQAVLTEFLENCPMPLTYSPSASDVYGSGNDLSIGAVGALGGSREGNFAVQNADLVIVIGSRLQSVVTGPDFDRFARAARIIVIDISESEHKKKTVQIDRLVIADAKAFLEELAKQRVTGAGKDWIDQCRHWKTALAKGKEAYPMDQPVNLYHLSECLSGILPEKAAAVCDAGFEELILPSCLHLKGDQRCLHPFSQGSMGYALPAAMGAYLAGYETVIALIGDGSIMMNIQELLTISYYRLPVKILIANNNMYAVIRKRQKDLFRERTIGTDEGNGVGQPDFEKIAQSYGIRYLIIENAGEMEAKLRTVMDMAGPVICEIMCTPDQDYLHCAYARNQQGRFVRRPIEDMSPFLDRERFKAEMMIDPVDE